MRIALVLTVAVFVALPYAEGGKRKAKTDTSAPCADGLSSLDESRALVDRLAGSHVRDIMASQMSILQDVVRKKLMSRRGVPSSTELRTEAEKLVFSRLLADAGKKGNSASDYNRMSDAEKESVSRSLFLRLASSESLAKYRDSEWFSKDYGGTSPPDEYFTARNELVDSKTVDAWAEELVSRIEDGK